MLMTIKMVGRFCTYLSLFFAILPNISLVSANCSDVFKGDPDLLVQISVSGWTNPEWLVKSTDGIYQHIKDKLQKLLNVGNQLPLGHGYTGFIVSRAPMDNIHESTSTVSCTVRRHANIDLENLLLRSAPPETVKKFHPLFPRVEISINGALSWSEIKG